MAAQRTVIITIFFFTLVCVSHAQLPPNPRSGASYWITAMEESHANYQEAVTSFITYWQDKEIPEEEMENENDPEHDFEKEYKSQQEYQVEDDLAFQYRRFMRWATLHQAFLREDGTIMTESDWNRIHQQTNQLRHQVISADWTPTGPNSALLSFPDQMSRIGRTCQIAFHPHDPQKMYVITGSGGLFISNDHGLHWQSTSTDKFPFGHQPASICIDHVDDQILYLGMGDANYTSQGHGIRKSTDGGNTWSDISHELGDAVVYEILMSPIDHLTLVVAAGRGIWKTTNGGASWQLRQSILGEDVLDLKSKPGSSDTIYACTLSQYYRSVNGGDDWQRITTGIELPAAGGRGMRLAVSANDPDVVYLGMLSWHGTVFKSTDGGTSFSMIYRDTVNQSLVTYSGSVFDNSNGNYNFSMVADPWNANIVYFGTQTLWKSMDAGSSFQSVYPYLHVVHPDIHDLEFSPLDHTLFNCNDGGIAISKDEGQQWSQQNDGIVAAEIYNGGQSPIRRDMFVIGTQDNGALAFYKDHWTTLQQGDVYDKYWFDYHTPDKYYSDRGGSLGLESNKYYNLHFPLTQLGNRKFAFTPADTNVAFLCQNEVWRCTDINSAVPTWTQITQPLSASSSDYIRDMVVSATDPNELYVIYGNSTLLHSINALSAIPVFDTLDTPASSWGICALALEKNEPHRIYFAGSNRIFRSVDQGNHWTDITDDLPDAAIVRIISDDFRKDGSLYVLCANRVFYRNDSLQSWVDYSQGLPGLAYVSDLQLYNDGSRKSVLRAVTYGRGIFETPLYNPAPLPAVDFLADTNLVCTHQAVNFTDASLDGSEWHWEFEGGIPATFDGQIPVPVYYNSPGIYAVTLTVSNANGEVTLRKNNFITARHHFSLPYSEGFEGDFPPSHMEIKSLEPSNVRWHLGYLGGFNASAKCAVFNDSYSPSKSDMRFNIDLSEISAAELTFDIAYARITGNIEFDSLEVLVSGECGNTFTTVYRKGGSQLVTMADVENALSFNPGPGDWRTESVDLTPFCGHENVFVYFRAWGSEGEIMLVDNILIKDPTTAVKAITAERGFQIVPNPSQGTFFIQGISALQFDVIITTLTGEKIYQHSCNGLSQPFEINLSDHPRGAYLVTVTAEGKTMSRMVVLD